MPRKPQSQAAPGIYQRGKTFWLRYTRGEQQIRVSLETSDPVEAIRRADVQRGLTVVSKTTGKVIGGKSQIDIRLEKYQAEKVLDGDFTVGSSKAASQAVRHFAAYMAVTDPNRITSEMLKTYYRRLNGTEKAEKDAPPFVTASEATAQTYTTRVGTFARWCGLRVKVPRFPEAPSRDVVIPKEVVEELITKATGEMKFVLMAGFFGGMRRGEISWARPEWFDIARRKINIPNPDLKTGWKPKSRRKRSVPLVPEFAAFIRAEYPDWKTREFCIRPEVAAGKAIYRFDIRKMFAAFARTYCPELTAHVMRHTFATVHANNPKISVAMLAEYTGDRLATLEKHYLHLDSDADEAAASFKVASKPEPEPDPNLNEAMPLPTALRRRKLDGDL